MKEVTIEELRELSQVRLNDEKELFNSIWKAITEESKQRAITLNQTIGVLEQVKNVLQTAGRKP